MMAFAVFYNLSDLQAAIDGLNRQDIPAADKALAMSLWSAGLSGYATAPLAPEDRRCVDSPLGRFCDDDCRIVVVDGKHQGKTLVLEDLRALLRRIATNTGVTYLNALANDMGGYQGAAEPWPVA
jgi:hypothetical protein